MDFLCKLGATAGQPLIDWEITPATAYGLFECRGDMRKIRSCKERYYYFYIDNWQKPPRLGLMERGLRYARVLAHIKAPQEMIDRCVANQGKAVKEQNYAIDAALKDWLINNLLAPADETLVVPVPFRTPPAMTTGACLPETASQLPRPLEKLQLRYRPAFIASDEIPGLITCHGFYEKKYNPAGRCRSQLAATEDQRTVADRATGLVWQRGGTDLVSWRRLQRRQEELNRQGYGGHHNWRPPTIEEALSLLTPAKNDQGLHIHPCFAPQQGYIFTADRRKPGGHWFVDFNQARVYWAAGTAFSGGFGRLCCSADTPPSAQ